MLHEFGTFILKSEMSLNSLIGVFAAILGFNDKDLVIKWVEKNFVDLLFVKNHWYWLPGIVACIMNEFIQGQEITLIYVFMWSYPIYSLSWRIKLNDCENGYWYICANTVKK